MKNTITTFLTVCAFVMTAFANPKTGHYTEIDGKSGTGLWAAIHTVANKGYQSLGYDGLLTAYHTTDVDANGNIIDMYGSCTSFKKGECGTYSKECDCYNREHSIPKSWWGGGTSKQGCDIFHVVPTDGYVNNRRGNEPFGIVGSSVTYTYNGNKLGSSAMSGYSGTVFEPMDEYKGDFARGYFGTLLKWELKATESNGSSTFSGNFTSSGNYGLTNYGVELLMKWHREDPVSEKELKRNDAIEQTQGNRNPFIDYPELAEYLWGTKKDQKVSLAGLKSAYEGITYDYPVITQPVNNSSIAFGPVVINEKSTQTITLKAVEVTKDFTLTVGGDHPAFFTVSPSKVTAAQALAGQPVAIIYQPTQTGNHKATLTISNGEASTVTVLLSGIGKAEGSSETGDMPNGDYMKVESTPAQWNGYYLIVNEEYSSVLKGNRDENGADRSILQVEINNNTIVADEVTNAAAFVLEVESDGITIKAMDDTYYGTTTNGNTISTSTEPIFNSVEIDTEGNAVISGINEFANRSLRYNNNNGNALFRFYQSGQKPIQLYRKAGSTPTALKASDVADYTIRMVGGKVCVQLAEPSSIVVYDYMGRIVASSVAESEPTFSLSQGLYIVRIGKKTEKVLVR